MKVAEFIEGFIRKRYMFPLELHHLSLHLLLSTRLEMLVNESLLFSIVLIRSRLSIILELSRIRIGFIYLFFLVSAQHNPLKER